MTVVFQKWKVDFSVDRKVIPWDAPNYFPPKVFSPGSVGDKYYSPLVKIRNAWWHVYNAPIVAFDVSEDKLNKYCKGNANHKIVHDKVVSICPKKWTVTLSLTTWFSFSRPVLYLSLDADHKTGLEKLNHVVRLKVTVHFSRTSIDIQLFDHEHILWFAFPVDNIYLIAIFWHTGQMLPSLTGHWYTCSL